LRKAAFAIKNSSTIILPQWFAILKELKLDERMMPRNVRTHWNSTYDMPDFAYAYRTAFDSITANQSMNLQSYELSKEEWKIVKHLRDVLAVRSFSLFFFYASHPF
jgi:hypothetical protein